MTWRILGSIWYTPPLPGLDALQQAMLDLPSPTVGVVAIAVGAELDYWKCYLGVCFKGSQATSTEEFDEQVIAANGSKVTKEVACAHFPELDPERFVF